MLATTVSADRNGWQTDCVLKDSSKQFCYELYQQINIQFHSQK